MSSPWRLILDGKGDGYYNMALDEAILLNYFYSRIPTLRIYGWDKLFISIGYNQEPHNVLTFNRDVPFVRRITGGAAILHDKELTYSMICSSQDLNLKSNVKESYKILCSFLLNFYHSQGLIAKFAKEVNSPYLGRYENFCFSSCEPFDLLIENKKIGGNAQRRKKDLIFQQGSIPQTLNFKMIRLLIKNTDNLEAKATSLDSLLEKPTDFFKLNIALADEFSKTFGITCRKARISTREATLVNELLKDKYRTSAWNFHKRAKITEREKDYV
jgi:lipoate-protein ligase A